MVRRELGLLRLGNGANVLFAFLPYLGEEVDVPESSLKMKPRMPMIALRVGGDWLNQFFVFDAGDGICANASARLAC